MKTDSKAANLLALFATYGFRKVSMSDIAKAAELSRQSVYNQFGSKDAVLEWAVTAFLDEVIETAVHRLKRSDGKAEEVLALAFQAWTGDHVPLLRGTPHGAEILDKAISSVAKAPRHYEREFTDAVAAFLCERGLSPAKAAAEDSTYVLNLASKGLLLKSETSEAYSLGMERVIKVLFD